MERKFWAKRRTKEIGPYPTRESALQAFRTLYPVKGADWKAAAKTNDIMTGYGEGGAWSDLQWDKARPE